jgi:hypothetical protein
LDRQYENPLSLAAKLVEPTTSVSDVGRSGTMQRVCGSDGTRSEFFAKKAEPPESFAE